MATRSQLALALAAVGLAGACAHAPPRPPRAEVLWPEPPEAPRVRLAAIHPDPDAPPPRRPAWRRLLDAIAGIDRAAERRDAFSRPFGVALAPDGTAWIADPDRGAVLRTGPRGPERVACRGREWSAPMGVAAGPGGAVYVADAGAAELVRIDADGGCTALGRGAFERPVAVAVDGERLAVVDPPRHQVVLLDARGEVSARWGSRGEGDGHLHYPTGIARAPDGTFLVVDAMNFRIVRLSAEGRWLGAFGAAGDSGAAFSRPKSVAVDEGGRVYVSDAQRDVVLVFHPDGALDYAVGAGGGTPGRLTLPAGVAVGGGRIWVADPHNRRVQVFEMLGGST